MRRAPMLTVDLGNTRLKACRWTHTERAWTLGEAWSGGHGELADFATWLARAASTSAALSSVAGAERTAEVVALLECAGAACWNAPPAGLENRCREPERVGADRLYAAAGAAELLGVSALVVDAGTALTVDALRIAGGSRAFLGGAIAPGPDLLAHALHSGTARLPRIEPRPGAHALGTVTEEALAAGVGVGFRGAAAALVEEVGREAGLGAAPVVLTGGAREFLLLPRPFTARVLEVVPELVHRGLLAALLRTLGAAERR
jgi:type III pantothenate kinase